MHLIINNYQIPGPGIYLGFDWDLTPLRVIFPNLGGIISYFPGPGTNTD